MDEREGSFVARCGSAASHLCVSGAITSAVHSTAAPGIVVERSVSSSPSAAES